MADAWEILTGNSRLSPASAYDAWEHLNAQGSGIGTVYGDGVIVTIEDNEMDVELEPITAIEVQVEAQDAIEVEVDLEDTDVEIDGGEVEI
jgi:uncharacterized protein YlxW (UPF0749 family)